MPTDKVLRMSTAAYGEAVDCLKGGHRIRAIKTIRAATNCGLRVAKLATERLAYERQLTAHIPDDDAMRIISGPRILKVTLDYGSGPIELDIEGMQLRALTELQTVGLEECSHMLHLVDIFKAITEGRNVFISDFNDD